jgi:hypothetical protein
MISSFDGLGGGCTWQSGRWLPPPARRAFQAITLSPVAAVPGSRWSGHNKKSRSRVAAAAPAGLAVDHRPCDEGCALRLVYAHHEIPL